MFKKILFSMIAIFFLSHSAVSTMIDDEEKNSGPGKVPTAASAEDTSNLDTEERLKRLESIVVKLQQDRDKYAQMFDDLVKKLQQGPVIHGKWWNDNSYRGWESAVHTKWEHMIFNQFKGSEVFQENMKIIIIPEDGYYYLKGRYIWRYRFQATKSHADIASYTSLLSTNGTLYDFKRHNLLLYCIDEGQLSHTGFLKKGEGVSLSTVGHEKAEWCLNKFSLEITKFR